MDRGRNEGGRRTEKSRLEREFFRREIYAKGPRAPEVRTYVYRCLHEKRFLFERRVTSSVPSPPLLVSATFLSGNFVLLLTRGTKSGRGRDINR